MESSAPAWVSWVSLGLVIVVPLAVLASRNWISAWITKGIQHEFDVKLEEVRATQRISEEKFKSELREKETEIGTLRNTVLSGSASRQTILDKRRFEAVEKIWTAVNDSAQLKVLSQTMAIINYGAVAKETHHPKVQKFLDMIGTALQIHRN